MAEELLKKIHVLPRRMAYLEGDADKARMVSPNYPLPVRAGTQSAFGEQVVAMLTPRVQADAVYGLRATDVAQFTTDSGSITAADNKWQISSGTTAGSLAILKSRRAVKYRPGLGVRFRLTAAFQAGVADSFQAAGCFNDVDFLGFGFNGTEFGIGHMVPGASEIQTLTLTVGASGSETATITLNGVAFPISLTAGSAAFNSAEIADSTFAGWTATATNGTVVFVADQAGVRAGSYSYASTGTSAGTLAETQAGVANDLTTNFVPQADWIHDAAPWLDPTGLNIYQITFGYLGAANFVFEVYNPSIGAYVLVHQSQFSNDPANVATNLNNPTLNCGLMVQSAGSTTDVTIQGASMFGGIDGKWHPVRDTQAESNTQTNVATEVNVLAIRCGAVFAGRINRQEILPTVASVAIEGAKPAEVKVYHNATIAGALWTDHDPGESFADVCTVKGVVSGGHKVATKALSGGGDAEIDLKSLGIVMVAGDTLVVSCLVNGGSGSDTTAAITWLED